MSYFSDTIEWLDNLDRIVLQRRLAAMKAGLCLKCGQPTGVPEGFTKMWCDSCIEKGSISFVQK